MRRLLSDLMLKKMKENSDIWILMGDLGYGMWDRHQKKYTNRVFNCGAAEQNMMGMAVGLAQEGKIPFVYSITNFVLYRPYETLRNYLNYENCPVKILASGRDKDYAHDGISHWSEDAEKILDTLPNIARFFPEDKSKLPDIVDKVINNKKPSFISLKR